MTHEPDTDGRAEVLVDLCPSCGALPCDWTQRPTLSDPLHAQAVAAGYDGVAEWVAAKDAEIAAAVKAVKSARNALHEHYTNWDGEPEDAVPLQNARSKCDTFLARQALAGDA
jgi:hypothetical protein